MVLWADRAELACVIEEHKCLILNVNEHVRFAISVHILELQRYRVKVLIRSDQERPDVNNGFRAVSTRAFENLDLSMQVNGDKMAWCAGIVMPNNSIGLEGCEGVRKLGLLAFPATMRTTCFLISTEQASPPSRCRELPSNEVVSVADEQLDGHPTLAAPIRVVSVDENYEEELL
jgi:hypothetical protein